MVAPPYWPGPFPPWDPRNFCGPRLVFQFSPPLSSGSLAVIDHVALKSAPMVGGGPLPRGRGRSLVEIVERPMCLKKEWGCGFKILVLLANYGFSTVWQGAGRGDLWSPPLPGQDPFYLGHPKPLRAFFGFLYFAPLPLAVAGEQSSLRRIEPRRALAWRGVDLAVSQSPPRWSGAAPSRKGGEDLPPTSVGGCCQNPRRVPK